MFFLVMFPYINRKPTSLFKITSFILFVLKKKWRKVCWTPFESVLQSRHFREGIDAFNHVSPAYRGALTCQSHSLTQPNHWIHGLQSLPWPQVCVKSSTWACRPLLLTFVEEWVALRGSVNASAVFHWRRCGIINWKQSGKDSKSPTTR